MKRYSINHTYGKTNRAMRYYVGKDTDDLDEAIEAAKRLEHPIFGHGIVIDWQQKYRNGMVIYHSGLDKEMMEQ